MELWVCIDDGINDGYDGICIADCRWDRFMLNVKHHLGD